MLVGQATNRRAKEPVWGACGASALGAAKVDILRTLVGEFSVSAASAPFRRRPAAASAAKRFLVILIKPSHYDAERLCGSTAPLRSPSRPTASPASTRALVRMRAGHAHALGPDVEIEIEVYDPVQHGHRRQGRGSRRIRAAGAASFIGLVGVQSAQPVPARARSPAASSAPPACPSGDQADST